MTKTIVVQGVQVDVSTPYQPGHALTEAEAKALNQLRLENIRNNVAPKVKELKDGREATELSQEELNKVTQIVQERDANYEFTMGGGGGGGRTADPLEKELRSLAREIVSGKIREKGYKIKDVPKEKVESLMEQVMGNEDVQKMAQKRLKEKQKIADASAADLDIG